VSSIVPRLETPICIPWLYPGIRAGNKGEKKGGEGKKRTTTATSSYSMFVLNRVTVAGILLSLCAVASADARAEYGEASPRSGVTFCLANQLGEIRGDIIFPWDEAYAQERRTSSRLYSNFPAAIVRVGSEEDIVKALACAAEYNVSVTARCGGHGNSGQASMSGAVMIDLKNLDRVEVSESLDEVVVGAGVTAGQAVYYTWIQSGGTKNLPVGQKPTVGMSGLTLGGGWGFFTRAVGLLCDQLTSIRMVLPDGRIVVATASNENSEIFWSSCGGGGGNIGIATEFTLKTMSVPSIITEINYVAPLTVDVIDFFQELSVNLPSSVTLNLELSNGKDSPQSHAFLEELSARPDSIYNSSAQPGGLFAELAGIYLGPKENLFADIERAGMNEDTAIKLSEFKAQENATVETSVASAQLNLMGWPNNGELGDLLRKYADQNTYYKYKSMFLFEKLPEKAIQTLIDAAYWNEDSSLLFEFQTLGATNPEDSAFALVGPTDTAFPYRNARHGLLLKSNSRDLAVAEKLYGRMVSAWTELLPEIAGRASYVNMIDTDVWDWNQAYYGMYVGNNTANDGGGGDGASSTLRRLQQLAYDTNPIRKLNTVQPIHAIPWTDLVPADPSKN
jgi:hypothetical protein